MYTPEQLELARTLGADYGAEVCDYSSPDMNLENYPGPLSGEFAGNPTPQSLMSSLGIDNPDEWDMSELCDAFEDGFYNILESFIRSNS